MFTLFSIMFVYQVSHTLNFFGYTVVRLYGCAVILLVVCLVL